MALKLFQRKKETPGRRPADVRHLSGDQATEYEPAEQLAFHDDPLHRFMQLERYGLISANLDEWRDHPDIESVTTALVSATDEAFAIVPAGFAALPETVDDYPGCPETLVETEPFLLARHTVTNAAFQKFVDAGGYEDLGLWPNDIWPHLIDFKDQTAHSAPRYWQNGRHHRRLAEHPVAGICSYEALAYARWAGYRLCTEAEWQMAASWRLRTSGNLLRRYPWGDAFNTKHCNVFSSGISETAPVSAYESGAAPNGVFQLIGNVWEWTSSDFNVTSNEGSPIVGDMLMKGIRGGAFDTYFAAQATSCFRTGLASLARRNNVGFRCVLDVPESKEAKQ